MVITNLLHHLDGWNNQEIFLKKVAKGIKPGGKIVIVAIKRTPLWKYYFTWRVDHIMYPGDYIEFPPKQKLREVFEQMNFNFLEVPVEIHQGIPYSYVLYTATQPINS